MGFNMDLNGDLNGDLMGIQLDLMGFNGLESDFNGDLRFSGI